MPHLVNRREIVEIAFLDLQPNLVAAHRQIRRIEPGRKAAPVNVNCRALKSKAVCNKSVATLREQGREELQRLRRYKFTANLLTRITPALEQKNSRAGNGSRHGDGRSASRDAASGDGNVVMDQFFQRVMAMRNK